MRACGHDLVHHQGTLGTDLTRPLDDPAGGPLQITLVGLGAVPGAPIDNNRMETFLARLDKIIVEDRE